ncbi:MAG: hypothetical protein OEW59_02985 [Gammaproteobacteria bacterium]|nr:hypothetical protein [Gammaproteobacteria bacterium]
MTTAAKILLSGIVLCHAGCTTMKPVEVPPEELRQMILTKDLLPPGETARIATDDGEVRTLRIVEVDSEARVIRGRSATVDVDEVIAVEINELSVGKTAVLAGTSYLVLWGLAIALSGAVLLP